VLREPKVRARAQVVLYAPDGTTQRAVWTFDRCVPLKLKAPPLNAKDGIVAIEELQIGYESLRLRAPEGASRG
jgi:phage tail-like protein